MTEIQEANIAVANFIIDELHKDKPFNLKLDVGQTEALHEIAASSHAMDGGYIRNLTVATWMRSGKGCWIEIDESNADVIYHMLSSYIAKHDRFGVMESLKEVS